MALGQSVTYGNGLSGVNAAGNTVFVMPARPLLVSIYPAGGANQFTAGACQVLVNGVPASPSVSMVGTNVRGFSFVLNGPSNLASDASFANDTLVQGASLSVEGIPVGATVTIAYTAGGAGIQTGVAVCG